MYGIVSSIVVGLLRVLGVTLADTQTISGAKTFSSRTTFSAGLTIPDGQTIEWPDSGSRFYYNAGGIVVDTGFATRMTVASTGLAIFNNYVRNAAGAKRLTSNVTNATTTMANLTEFSVTVLASSKYRFKLVLFVANSTAADGIKLDFDGGTATMTGFRCHGIAHDAALQVSTQTAALATDVAVASITGNSLVVVEGCFEVNGGGTFIPRVAMNAATAGTLTVYACSNLVVEEMA